MSKTMNSNKKFQLTADIVNNLFTKMQDEINDLKNKAQGWKEAYEDFTEPLKKENEKLKEENEKLKNQLKEKHISSRTDLTRAKNVKDFYEEKNEKLKEDVKKLKDKNIRIVQKCKKFRKERDEFEEKLETANDVELSEKYENLKIHFKTVQNNFEDYKENQKTNDTYQTDKKAKEAIAKIKKEQLKYKRLYDKKCRDIKKVKAELEEEKNKEFDGIGADVLEQMGLFKFCCDCGTHFEFDGDSEFDYENNICLECKN